ncbi:LOW QUALITY PROTEIN: Hypothetical protein PHPALM_6122 [Phytophthora palmivora]|uniref:DUF7869 domain-containing protein n=1 Tax=Phytophthora palmivora TaxID=4796 RepID=A0A2P4YFQ4_9STRA|nr:LOW QUALITY PROTEIN: Hypothetical protein PHPALM_6122 [Phytophthora palmivora]
MKSLLRSLSTMTRSEKTLSRYTLLGTLMRISVGSARRYGLRDMFAYSFPFVGKVYRSSIGEQAHGNTLDKNVAAVDSCGSLSDSRSLPRGLKTNQDDGKKYFSSEMYTLLPAHFTWDVIYDEMHTTDSAAREGIYTLYYEESVDVAFPDYSYPILQKQSISRGEGRDARTPHGVSKANVSIKYKKGEAAVSDKYAVSVMDFSQNSTVPSVASHPSQSYVCSLLFVSCFREIDGVQTNYLYDETASGKGSEKINSILEYLVWTKVLAEVETRLIVYADNNSGQNKSNYVINFLLAQVDMGLLRHIDYKFFVKSHAKNSCDRGFVRIRKHIAKEYCYTVAHIVDAVKEFASNYVTVHIPRGSKQLKTYKALLTELYKFRTFSVDEESLGVVSCRKCRNDDPINRDLRRNSDDNLTTKKK